MAPEGFDVGLRYTAGRFCHDARLDQATGCKHLSRVFRRWIGYKSTAISFAMYKTFECKHLQCVANYGSADIKKRSDLRFRKLCSRRQPPVHNCIPQGVAYGLGPIFLMGVHG